MEEVFVTGATGVLGKRVVKLLISKGHKVKALSRSQKNTRFLNQIGAIPIEADLFNEDSMIMATRNCKAIFHLATCIPKKSMASGKKDWEMNDRIRIEGTNNLLIAATVNGIKTFIQQSVVLIYGNKGGGFVNSTIDIAPKPIQMVESAITMEELIKSYRTVNHVILRLGNFYSADSYSTLDMLQSIKNKRVAIIGNGDQYWNFIHADDAATAIYYTYVNFDRLMNKTLDFTDFSPLSFSYAMTSVARLTNSKDPKSIPHWLAKVLLNKDIYGFMTNSFRIMKNRAIHDWNPKYPNFVVGMTQIISELKRAEQQKTETSPVLEDFSK